MESATQPTGSANVGGGSLMVTARSASHSSRKPSSSRSQRSVSGRSSRSGFSALGNSQGKQPWDRMGMTHLEYVETQPMPVIVVRTLGRIHNFMKKAGLKSIDLFRRKDINTSIAERGDELLSVDEVVALLKKMSPDIDPRDVRITVQYLDTNDNGELDHSELQSALRRAKRDMIKLDGMAKLAELSITDPQRASRMMNLPTSQAIKTAMRASKSARGSSKNSRAARSAGLKW